MRMRSLSSQFAIAANQNLKERQYWLNTFADEPVKSRFPFSYDCSHGEMAEKGSGENRQMAEEEFLFSFELYNDIIKLSKDVDLKLHMIMVAGLVALLVKYTGSHDIITGSPILKQEKNAEFINTILAFRTTFASSVSFKELLLQVKETIVNATRHQNFPLDALIDLLNIRETEVGNDGGEANGYPLFDVALLLHNIHDKTYLDGINYNMLFCFHRDNGFIKGIIEYNRCLYQRNIVQQIICHYTRLLRLALEQMDVPLSTIDILSADERRRLLEEFNSKNMEYSSDKTFTGLFQDVAEKNSIRPAVINESNTLTYKELDEKANCLARRLRQKGVGSDTIVAIMVERSLDMIIAVIGVIKSGGAYLPLDPEYPIGRSAFILKDSGTRLLLTQAHLIEKIQFDGDILTVEIEEEGYTPKTPDPADSHNLIYVIYTSGSTGQPKGVMVQHNHFINIALGWQKEYCLQDMEVCLLQMASFSFDVFAGDLARTFINAGKMIINPMLRADAESLYRLINTYRVTLFESTPSYIIPFMKYVYDNNLPIDSLRLLILGSDSCPVRDYKELIRRFGKQMRIVNSYGVTEATIDSSYYEEYNVAAIPTGGSVPIGKPLPNVKFYIFDEAGNLTPPGVPGTLYIGGSSVTRGYLNRPELTAEKFDQDLWENGRPRRGLHHSSFIVHHSNLYCTGDLARWLYDGNMEFLGRSDYQVKVRGYRIELGEIESKLLEHEHIKEAVVTEKADSNQDKYLCGYYTTHKTIEAADLREYLGRKLPDYMVPWFFVKLEQFPLTPNGKIDRKALPDPESTFKVQYEAPRDGVEQTLISIWQQVFGININDQETIGIDHRFFDLGGNSLKAIIMISQIQKSFNVKLTLADIFNVQTIRGIAEQIRGSTKVNFIPIEKAEKKSYYHLSSSQKRLYFLQQLDSESTVYNILVALLLKGKLEKQKLEQVFIKLIQRHESLRTSFNVIDDEPIQLIHNDVEFKIEYHDLEAKIQEPGVSRDDSAIIKSFIRPFDLTEVPLLRVGLLRLKKEEHILLVDMHHIISDAASHQVLVQDFVRLYRDEELTPLELHYKDYCEWWNRQTGEIIKRQESYWLKQFSGNLPVLELPTDFPRSRVQNFDGRRFSFKIEKIQTDTLKIYALKKGASLQMIMLAIFNILLSKLTQQDDIIIGIPVAGRRHANLEKVIGFFVNTLALRSFPTGDKTFWEFLTEVRESCLKAYENQDYPFDILVKKLNIERDTGRNPLFDIMMEVQENDTGESKENIEIPDLKVLPYKMETRTSKMELDWFGIKTNHGFFFEIFYITELFKEESIKKLSQRYLEIIDQVIENKNIRLEDIKISHGFRKAESVASRESKESFSFEF